MNSTYTLTEGNDALNRVLLMMRYDMGKTLSENVILEQPDEKFDTPYTKELMKKYNSVKIDAPTLSEWLLEVREFLFTPFGASLQVGLSIAGAEVGAPILFLILDGAIIINDAYMMVRDWDPNGPEMSIEVGPMGSIQTKGSWEWFKFHFTTNVGFQNLIIDIAAILIPGGILKLGKSTLKSAGKMFKLLVEKFGPNFMKTFVSFLEKFKPKTDGLPKELGSWVERKYSEITKAIELWKTPTKAVKTVVKPKRLAFAVGASAGAFKLVKWLESKSEAIAKFFEENPGKDSVLITSNIYDVEDKVIIDIIREENPMLFSKDFKIKSFKTKVKKSKNNKYDVEDVEYYLINNVKYVPVDLPKSAKLKKIA
jgi:hypothetical protein